MKNESLSDCHNYYQIHICIPLSSAFLTTTQSSVTLKIKPQWIKNCHEDFWQKFPNYLRSTWLGFKAIFIECKPKPKVIYFDQSQVQINQCTIRSRKIQSQRGPGAGKGMWLRNGSFWFHFWPNWLRKWHDNFQPITKQSNKNVRNSPVKLRLFISHCMWWSSQEIRLQKSWHFSSVKSLCL